MATTVRFFDIHFKILIVFIISSILLILIFCRKRTIPSKKRGQVLRKRRNNRFERKARVATLSL